MPKKAAVLAADGFESIELTAPVDILRRGGVTVKVVSVMADLHVVSAQNIEMTADKHIEDVNLADFDAVIIPGGSVGVDNLKAKLTLAPALREFMENPDKTVGSICAGPTVLAYFGLLDGRRSTCYPGCEEEFPTGVYSADEIVTVDGSYISATGPGTAIPFGLALLSTLAGDEVAKTVAEGMLVR